MPRAGRRPVDAAESVFDAAPLALVAVDTGRGVHVSPQAFAWAAGRLWLLAPSDSLKVRVVRRSGVAGVTVPSGDGRAVMVTGRARVLEAWPPSLDLASAPAVALLGAGALAYGKRNAAVAAGVALDALSGRMGLPGARSVLSVEPTRWALFDGDEVVDHDGWLAAEPIASRRRRRSPVSLSALPRALRTVVSKAAEATVGWPGPAGPVALVAVPEDLTFGRVRVPAAVADLLGPPEGEGCVMVHASPGNRPGEYRGVLLRGPIDAGARRAGGLVVTVRPTRLTWWEGYRSATAPRSDGR